MIEKEKYIGQSKLLGNPEKPMRFKLGKGVVKTDNIADAAIIPEKLSGKVKDNWLNPALDTMFNERIRPLIESLEKSEMSTDLKYKAITDELYTMIASLQVGGIALSNELGDREDIGVTQKALTKIIGKIWEAIQDPSHRVFDFTLTVVPTMLFKETEATAMVTADCSQAISDFDNVKVYVNGELKAESSDVSIYTTHVTIDRTSMIKVEGTILGKTIIKEQEVTLMVPFFMGSGQQYTDVVNMECHKQLIGTLEGDYDLTVKHNGDYMFIIIPVSHKDEFRRADMNGLGIKIEIPMASTTYDDYVVYKSLNTYKAGTYNIDIDINS